MEEKNKDEYKPNPIMWFLYSMLNSYSGNKSCEFQTDLVNMVCDTIERMEESEFNSRVRFDKFSVRVIDGHGNGHVEIWWENAYYACGYTRSYRKFGGDDDIPHDRYPDMKTRMRLIDLKNRLISEKRVKEEEKYRQMLKCMDL